MTDHSSLTFYGASDDLIEVEGAFTEEYSREDGQFLVIDGERHLRVRVWYTEQGTWAVAAWQLSEDFPGIPGTVTFHGYTAKLTLDVGSRVSVQPLWGESS